MENIQFERINVKDEKTLEELYDCSALTLEGLRPDNIQEFLQFIKKFTDFKVSPVPVYVIEGSVMNHFYGLRGNNAYRDELNIISIKLESLENFANIVVPRFQIGARWFDDIVDNNRRNN